MIVGLYYDTWQCKMIQNPQLKCDYKCNALKFPVNENPQSFLTTFPINTMSLQTCTLPGLSCFLLARGGAIMVHNSYTPWAFVVCLICTPKTQGLQAHGCTCQANHSCPWHN